MSIPAAPASSSSTTTLLRVSRALVWLVYAYVVVCEVILALGFVLRLFGANPSVGFVQWAYRSLDRVMAPFRGIFTPIELGPTANEVPAVLDSSILFAMVVYGILMLAIRHLIDWLTRRLLIAAASASSSIESSGFAESPQPSSTIRPVSAAHVQPPSAPR